MQILNRKHPIYFVASACICVGAAAVVWHLASESWQTETFWKTAAFSLVALLAVLTAVLFKAVSRMYPRLNPFSSKH